MIQKNKLLTFMLICVITINTSIFYKSNLTSVENDYQISSNPKNLASHPKIEILSNLELDNFCDGNGTDGLTPETAHVINDFQIDVVGPDSAIYLENITRFLIIKNSTITNAGVLGMDPQAAIRFINCTNISIKNCTIRENGVHGIYMKNCDSILIDNSIISQNNNYGVYYTSTNNSIVMNSNVSDNGWEGVYYTVNCHNNEIVNNTLSFNRHGIYSYKSSTNLRITDNSIFDNDLSGIYSDSTSYNIISDNSIFDNSDTGIYFESTSNNTISNNEILGSSHLYGIYIELSTNNIIYNNTIFDVNQRGITLYETNCTTVEENDIQRNDWGLEIWGGESGNYNIIKNNNFSNNSGYGIVFDDACQHNQILNNIISDNTDYAVYLTDQILNTTIYNNRILNNSGSGIYIDRDSSNNTISYNIIHENQNYAMHFEDTHNNSIIKNNMEDNYGGIDMNSAHNQTIYGNSITNNTFEGIYASNSNFNYFAGNNISRNENGIILEGSNNNVVWMNFFCNNSVVNGMDTNGDSFWDNGTVGNYWGDYQTRYPLAVPNDNIWSWEYEVNASNPNESFVNDTHPLASVANILEIISDDDLKYVYGQTNNIINWIITGNITILQKYWIFLDDEVIQLGFWKSGEEISLNVDGLPVGIYDYRIIATDGTAWRDIDDIIRVEVGLLPGKPIFKTASQTITKQNITVNWEETPNADSYDIYINDTFVVNTDETEMFIEFTGNGSFSIHLVAINEYGESTPSEQIIITIDLSSDQPGSYIYYLVGGGFVIIAVGAGIFIIIKKKKK